MFLQSISIRNFRSIEQLRLGNCRELNILIGKNNAGKSNILSAIHAVFVALAGGRIVVPRPEIGREIYFFNKNTQQAIDISLDFSLALAERDALLRDIASEVPHMKNAVDGLDPSLWLSITLSVNAPPKSYAVVRRIMLARATEMGSQESQPERLILEVGTDAATELSAKASRATQLTNDARIIHSIPDRMPSALLRGADREDLAKNYMFRNLTDEVSAESLPKLESVIRAVKEPTDFSREAHALATALEREATEVQREQLKNKIKTFSGEETSVPVYVSNLLDQIGSHNVLYLHERRKPIGKEEAQQLLELKMSRGGPQILRRIQENVAALLGVQIDAFRGDSRSRRSEAEAELDVDNFLVQVNGSGIREALRLILDNEFGNPSLLLVEEPEMHLHPALETSVMRYLQNISRSCQVFVSTHSTNFLDAAELTNIYLVSKNKSTTVQLLDLEAAETILPRELGLRMSSLFMYDRLVFVEGLTDESIIREWASTLKVNLSQANVGFVRMGGARNFSHYAAAATLSFLAKRRVQCWILLDRDEQDQEEIKRFQQTAKDYATVKVLDQREIENLLICPRAIAELIKGKLRYSASSTADSDINEQAVQRTIEDVLAKLKSVAVDKRVTKALCLPLYFRKDVHDVVAGEDVKEKVNSEIDRLMQHLESTRKSISDVHNAKLEEVEKNWKAHGTELAPGELVLDHVLQKFGVRFNKDHDGPRLASLMKEDEIDFSMRSLIREIGTT